MRQFIDVTGKTEEEAIQNALRQLGLDRDDVSVEILERAKSGFLGLGSCPAKVRVSYGPEEEEEPAAPAEAEARQEEPKPVKAEKKPRQERKAAEKPAAPAEAPEAAPEEKQPETVRTREAVRSTPTTTANNEKELVLDDQVY